MEVKAKEFEPRSVGWDFKELTTTLMSGKWSELFRFKTREKKIWFVIWAVYLEDKSKPNSQTSNIESNNSQNGGLEDYNNISDGIFPHFTTPSIKTSLG